MHTQATHTQSGPAKVLPQLLHLHPRPEEAPATSHWHPRDTLLFIVGTCGGFWSAVTLAFLKV